MQRVLTNIDLAGNEVVNLKLENLSELPVVGVEGRLIYLSTDKRVYFHNGQNWVVFGGDIPIASEGIIGGIKIGNNLTITEDGLLSTSSVLQYFDMPNFPETGNTGKLYISLSNKNIYIWDNTNSRYLMINEQIDFVQPEISVSTLSPGQPATATVEMEGTGLNKKLIFNLGIPKGDTPNITFTLEDNGNLYIEY